MAQSSAASKAIGSDLGAQEASFVPGSREGGATTPATALGLGLWRAAGGKTRSVLLLLTSDRAAGVPLQSCSCLDKHVCSGDYLNDDSLQQARAPYHTQPRSADLGLGMQIRQEAALPDQGHPGLVTAAITLLQLQSQPG